MRNNEIQLNAEIESLQQIQNENIEACKQLKKIYETTPGLFDKHKLYQNYLTLSKALLQHKQYTIAKDCLEHMIKTQPAANNAQERDHMLAAYQAAAIELAKLCAFNLGGIVPEPVRAVKLLNDLPGPPCITVPCLQLFLVYLENIDNPKMTEYQLKYFNNISDDIKDSVANDLASYSPELVDKFNNMKDDVSLTIATLQAERSKQQKSTSSWFSSLFKRTGEREPLLSSHTRSAGIHFRK